MLASLSTNILLFAVGGVSVNEMMFRHRFQNAEKPARPLHVGYDVPPASYAAHLAMRAYRQMSADSFNAHTCLSSTHDVAVVYPGASASAPAPHLPSWEQPKCPPAPAPTASLHSGAAELLDETEAMAASFVSYAKGSPLRLPLLDPRMQTNHTIHSDT